MRCWWWWNNSAVQGRFCHRWNLRWGLPGLMLWILLLAGPVSGQSVYYPRLVAVITAEESPSGPLKQAGAVDVDADGNVYIVDRGNNRLLKFSGDRFVREVGGFGNEGDQFDDPRDVDASLTLDILVADYNNERIVRFDRNLNFVTAYSGQSEEGDLVFGRVKSVAYSNQLEIFLIDDDQRQVVKLDRLGNAPLFFGSPEEPYGQLLDPFQLTVSTQQVFVSDPGQAAVLVYDFLGNFISRIQVPDFQPGALDWAPDKELLVLNQQNQHLLAFNRHYQLKYSLIFRELTSTIQDVAIWAASGDNIKRIYVLTEHQCRIYEYTQTNK